MEVVITGRLRRQTGADIMPPPEVSVTCPGCGYQLRIPVAAVRRDNTYCSQCGKRIHLSGVQVPAANASPGGRTNVRKSSRNVRRR